MKSLIYLIISTLLSSTKGFLVVPTMKRNSRAVTVMNMAMPKLPPDVEKYSQVPVVDSYFTNEFIPAGLLKEHSTKDGTWGVIRVDSGKLEYRIGEEEIFELSPDNPGIIVPNVKHSVKSLSDDLQFIVEFYRLPDTGPVDEQREGL
mmetsp:Transcript_9659/g.13635  ORF Transcript_9659/g.13635 Transcript_9659/m.13635 type:complete len:147 (+) Transcript_9659:130-570(+)